MNFRFEVPGKPVPQGSTRTFMVKGKPVTTNKTPALTEYRANVRYYAEACGLPLIKGPAYVFVVFTIQRPKAHYNAAGEVKPSAPSRPTTRPDADKLLRSVLDGLTGVCFDDDAQVVDIEVAKLYGKQPSTIIEVRAA